MRRRTILKLPLLASAASGVVQEGLEAAVERLKPRIDPPGPLRFAVMGDMGSGSTGQHLVARQMELQHQRSPIEFVLTTGDNIYENGEEEYFDSKFVDVYRPLLEDGVEIRSSLGNHDMRHKDGQAQVRESAFGYENGQEEYHFEAGPILPNGKRLARFICLNSNRWDEEDGKALEMRRDALRETLRDSDRYQWNIAYMHHPLYSYVKSAFLIRRGHGGNKKVRELLEPEFIDRVDAVFAGHDHFYQKVKPQHGIEHFVTGGAGKLRKGVKTKHEQVEKGALEYHFMDLSLDERSLSFQAISGEGLVIHSGTVAKREARRLADIGKVA